MVGFRLFPRLGARSAVVCALTLAAGGCCLARPAFAAALAADTWETKTVLSQEASFDSNPLLRIEDKHSLYGSQTSAQLSHQKQSERTAVRFDGEARQGLYNDQTFNSTDFHGTADMARRTQKLAASLSASGDYDTTRTGELIDLGLATTTVRRTAFNVAPSLDYSLTPLDKASLMASYANTTYDDAIYTDYHLYSLLPSYTRALSPQDEAVLSCGVRRYQSDEGVDKTVDTLTPMAGFHHRFTEKWSLRGGAGLQFSSTKTKGFDAQSEDGQAVYLMKVLYDGEQDDLSFEAQRKQQSFANNSDELLTAFAVSGKREIDKTLSLQMSVRYQYLDSPVETSGSTFENLLASSLGVAYGLSPHASLTASYGYKRENRTDESRAATQNLVRLGFNYQYDWAAAQ